MSVKQYDISPFSLNEKIEFFGAFYNYLDASIPLTTALSQMLNYTNNLKIKNVLKLILKETDKGKNFADVILGFKKPLGGVYCNLISVGVQTGELPEILKDINDMLIKQRNFKATIIKACAYPAFLLVVFILAILLYIFFIRPALISIQTMNSGGSAEAFCIAHYMRFMGLIPFITVGLIIFYKLFKKSLISQSGLTLPAIGPAVRYYNLSSFARLLAISYKAGIPITQAIMLSAASIPNKYMGDTLLKSAALVTKKPIAKVFGTTGFFAPDMIMKIESGDMSGNLDRVFYEISATISLKLETAILAALKLLEPTLIVLISCAVGYFVYSFYSLYFGALLSI